MKPIKEIIFFTAGDSNQAATWSNVPYLFTRALEERGVRVRRVNIIHNRLVALIYNAPIIPLLKFFYKAHSFSWRRTQIHRWFVERTIKRAVERYPAADLCVITNYDYYNKFNSIPTLLFSDWVYEIRAERRGAKIYPFEQAYIRQQSEAMNGAEFVVSLFPKCATRMRELYPEANIHYIDRHVINNLYDGPITEELIERKGTSPTILFIGRKKYRKGARVLLEAFKLAKQQLPELKLNIIGMSSYYLGALPEGVTCHGYLDKGSPAQRAKYYDLLTQTSLIVNPSPEWGGYSSMVEAMYFYTPVVVAPYVDFVENFGREIEFGRYNEMFTPEVIAENIIKVLTSPNYPQMASSAHEAVKEYTWGLYVEDILELVRK